MAKSKTFYVCSNCGYESPKWLGRCSSCGEWDTMVEKQIMPEVSQKAQAAHARRSLGTIAGLSSADLDFTLPSKISDINEKTAERIDVGMGEFNRVLGGGLVPGTLVLLAGDPGIGKSTLLLQAATNMAAKSNNVWYITGEESLSQVKIRAKRMNAAASELSLWAQTDMGKIIEAIQTEKPTVVIIDSIQTMYLPDLENTPGSLTQIRECTGALATVAKSLHIPVILVGHVTKEGAIAGPRVLEHMVDAVLQFEGERHYPYRILRAVKNRFGSTFEIGVFEMTDTGLGEVTNPSFAFLEDRPLNAPGSSVAACIEGTRPMLAEVQGLLSSSSLAYPRRIVNGADLGRVNMILAVLEKRVGLPIANQDAYVNITGGVRLSEPAMDLAIAAAIVSSFKNRPLIPNMAVMGEIGLSGEVRPVSFPERRAAEAEKLGLTKILAPKGTKAKLKNSKIEVIEARSLIELIDMALM